MRNESKEIAALYQELRQLELAYQQGLDRIVFEHKKKVQAILDRARVRNLSVGLKTAS